jgi:dTDP-glucose 4,6-dehydratase
MGRPVTVFRGHTRTSSYLEDTCRTLCNITENFKPDKVYNIGGTELHDIETLANIVWNHTGADPLLIKYSDEEEIMTTRSKRVDVSKAVADLNHNPTVSLDEGIHRTISWMRAYYNLNNKAHQ